MLWAKFRSKHGKYYLLLITLDLFVLLHIMMERLKTTKMHQKAPRNKHTLMFIENIQEYFLFCYKYLLLDPNS